ncbi:MAG TPA: molybdopterin-binding protein [Polyangiaceae bacterium]|jgi:molybdenum cofactor synthesis domain-containing protein|nr:molybdopterin-binding protein [Polyangiaceae bacterium]
MRVVHSACAVLIGNELLSGKVRDENLHALASTLRSVGIALDRALVLPDQISVLVRELKSLRSVHDLIVTSGGVGPTHDDVTLEAVAQATDAPCAPNAELLGHLRAVYGVNLTTAQASMASVPAGSRLYFGPDRIWPTIAKDEIWMLPGVPELFRAKLATLREHLRGPDAFHTKSVFSGLDELELKELLDQVVASNPEVEVGSYPKWSDPSYKTRITLDGRLEANVLRALQQLLEGLPAGEPRRVE